MAKKQIDGNLALEQQRVIVIPAHDEIVARKLRVAAYARVSSSSEDQLNSYRVQNQYYSELISNNPDREMVDIYADEGITGTSVEKREDFQRMMQDCRKGKIDRILVKSISRFARNTKDCLAAVRELKELGVSVLFEEQGIDTARVSSEMVTAIMASLAQKQSESISGNVQWSIQHQMEAGKYKLRTAPFGYTVRNGELTVNEAEAPIVQDIFNVYLSGANTKEICDRLNAQQGSSRKWLRREIDYILMNERYAGNAIFQKKYTRAELPRTVKRNHGERAMYYVSDSNAPIIPQNVFDRAQELRKRRTVSRSDEPKVYSGKIQCSCGSRCRAKTSNQIWYWSCVVHEEQRNACHIKQVPEETMTDEKPRVIIIPPKPETVQTAAVAKQLRVAAYCRVSTKEEEQASSYEAQCEYYTDKIMSNKEWTMAGIFADEGITGTSTKKRTEFLRMIRQCKQKKIDLILTKSIQRFARNTLDCINYTRILRQLGIGVLFEKENINSLPTDSEFMITMYGAMAQSESESISGNIRRGRQMHAKVGTLKVPCYRLYGYEKDTEGKFRVIPEQAEIVRELYKRYESGASLRNLQDWLEENQIKTVLGESKWTTTSIKSILTNEKYCGDVLLQKTFRTDVISKKVIKNIGQMAQYYMPNHHEAIVSREQYNAVKAEMARRSALRSPSKTAVTGRSCYTSKYALSDRLVCGECGTLYRRCTWISLGRKYPVWRCTSRLNYGTKYCRDSPTIKEEQLQAAILAAINSAMSNKTSLLDLIKNAVSLELLPVQGQTMSLADIEHRLAQLDEQFQQLLAEAIDTDDKETCNAQFAEILAEQTSLKKQKETILQSSMDTDRVCTRMKQAEQAIESAASTITEWNENAVRQTVERVTVLSVNEILVRIKGGAEIKQRLER